MTDTVAGPRASAAPWGPDRPLRLVQLVDSLVTGGAERLVVSFAEAVAARPEFDLTVVTLSDADTPFRREIEAMGTRVIALPDGSVADPRRLARLVAVLRTVRAEVVHAHLTSSIILGAAATAVQGARFAASVHNVQSSTRRVRWARRRMLGAALASRRTTRIAVGHKVADAARCDAGGKPFLVVPNAVPPSAVWTGGDRDAARGDLQLAPDDVGLLAVGTIIAQKGYEDLVEAFACVAARHPGAQLRVIGAFTWPELKARLDKAVAAHGLGDRVRFLGLRRDVARLLAAGDLFVSSSHWEGAPVSLIEAMANGLAPLVTDVGDNARTLKGTGASLVPPGEPERFAEALDALLAAPARRTAIATAAKRRAMTEYGTDVWVDRLWNVYAGMRTGTVAAQ